MIADRGEGVGDPGADLGVAVLAYGVIVGAGGGEGDGWVEGAEVEDLVGEDCEVGVEGVEEGAVGGEEGGGGRAVGGNSGHVLILVVMRCVVEGG